MACLSLPGEDLTVRWMDWRDCSGEERWMTAVAGDWFAVPRRGRVEDAVGATLGAVRGAGAARDRRRGMFVDREGGLCSATGYFGGAERVSWAGCARRW